MKPDQAGPPLTKVPVWLAALLVPFVLAGLFAVAAGIRMIWRGEIVPGVAVAAFGGLFVALPAAAYAALLYTRREERRLRAVRAAEPDRPWLWRQDFASGVIRPEGEAAWIALLVFSLVWNCAALAGAWLFVRERGLGADWLLLAVLVFPAAGVGLLWWTAVVMARRMRYRRTVLRLDATPAALGGRLKGSMELPVRLEPGAGFQLTLECLRRTRNSEGESLDSVLWESRTTVPAALPAWSEGGSVVPVAIPIPDDCQPWNDLDPDRQVIWRLRVSASVGGPNLDLMFEVPVFRTRPRGEAAPEEAPPEGFLRVSARAAVSGSAQVRIEENAAGALFIFPPHGGAKSVLAVVVAAAVTGAAAWGIHAAGAPLAFPIFIGLFGLVPVAGYLWSAAGYVLVRTGAGGVELTYRLWKLRKTWKTPPGEVLEAGLTVAGQAGGNAPYSILLRRRTGRPYLVLVMLKDKREAEWIAGQLNRRLQGPQAT